MEYIILRAGRWIPSSEAQWDGFFTCFLCLRMTNTAFCGSDYHTRSKHGCRCGRTSKHQEGHQPVKLTVTTGNCQGHLTGFSFSYNEGSIITQRMVSPHDQLSSLCTMVSTITRGTQMSTLLCLRFGQIQTLLRHAYLWSNIHSTQFHDLLHVPHEGFHTRSIRDIYIHAIATSLHRLSQSHTEPQMQPLCGLINPTVGKCSRPIRTFCNT